MLAKIPREATGRLRDGGGDELPQLVCLSLDSDLELDGPRRALHRSTRRGALPPSKNKALSAHPDAQYHFASLIRTNGLTRRKGAFSPKCPMVNRPVSTCNGCIFA